MEDPFNISDEKLKELLSSYETWMKSIPQEAEYEKKESCQIDADRIFMIIRSILFMNYRIRISVRITTNETIRFWCTIS
jgi:hypothetical protein